MHRRTHERLLEALEDAESEAASLIRFKGARGHQIARGADSRLMVGTLSMTDVQLKAVPTD